MNWDLTYLYKDDAAWQDAYQKCKEYVDDIAKYQGKLKCKTDFLAFMHLNLKLNKDFGKIYHYAFLKSDLNKKDVAASERLGLVQNLFVALQQATSWCNPEILGIGKENVDKYLACDEEVMQYRFIYEQLFHQNEHILDAKSEGLLALFAPLFMSAERLYSSLSVADNVSGEVVLNNNVKVKVTQGNWQKLISGLDAEDDRRKVFSSVFSYYAKHKSTYADIYNDRLQADIAQARARGYATVLDSFLYQDNIPTSIYLNLVDVARKENNDVKRYYELRRKYLHLEKHRTYDRFIPLAKANKEYTYDDAKDLFFASISAFPQDFIDKAHVALETGFVDVYEKEGKQTGGYSANSPDVRPFILLNYNNSLEDVFTVAHEAGHSIHSLYCLESQPTVLQNYAIFVGEIASTFNEHVLLDYLLEKGLSKDEKIVILQQAIDEIIGTFYRQTLFAAYEYEAHEMAVKGRPINWQVLSDLMISLYREFYGIDIKEEKYKEYVWAYIPHLFYSPFYVYQYATSFAASFKIYKDVKEKIPGAFSRYVSLLKAGGSKYPTDIALLAGVDFTKKETFMAVAERLKELVDELASLLE